MSLFVVLIATRLFAVLAKEEGFFFLLPLSSSDVSHVDLQRTEPGCHRPRVIPSLNVIRGGRHFDTPVRRVGDAGKQNGASSEEKREKCSRGVGKKMQERETASRRRISIFLCVARVLVNAGVSGLRATCRERTGPQKRNKQTAGGITGSPTSQHTHETIRAAKPPFLRAEPFTFFPSLFLFRFKHTVTIRITRLESKAKHTTVLAPK